MIEVVKVVMRTEPIEEEYFVGILFNDLNDSLGTQRILQGRKTQAGSWKPL